MIDKVDLGVELDELVFAQRQRRRNAQQDAEQRADQSDHQALSEKYSPDGSSSHSHGLEDPDLAGLVGHDHREVADDVERRDEHDEQENQPHPELLELQGLE